MIYVKAILALVVLIKDLVDWIKEATKDDPAKFLEDLQDAVKDAKEKKDVKKLQDMVKRL